MPRKSNQRDERDVDTISLKEFEARDAAELNEDSRIVMERAEEKKLSAVEAFFRPQVELRQRPVVAAETALLFIDTQNFNCHQRGALFERASKHDKDGYAYFFERLAVVEPNWVALQKAGRNASLEVMYTVIQSLTKDGRDRSLDYKISCTSSHNLHGLRVIDAIKPLDDEIVLPKTSADVFTSTNLDYLLRCMGKKYVVLVGCLTDQCVESAVRHACDLGYLVTLITDACATMSEDRHVNCLKTISGFCRQRTTAQFLAELTQSQDK